MSDELFEFVDYIFDRYTYLGIESTAPREDIEEKIKKNKSQNHPDLMGRLDEKLQQAAKWNWELAEKCADILLKDEIRSLYDERLEQFKKDTPQLVSISGHPILDLNRGYIDLGFLTSVKELNLTELKNKSAQIASYTVEEFEEARRLYVSGGHTGPYTTALRRKITYLEILEKQLWAAAGIFGEKYTQTKSEVMDTALFIEAIDEHITHISNEVIPRYTAQRKSLALLAEASTQLLLPSSTFEISNAEIDLTAIDAKIAQTRFLTLSKAIRTNAKEKAEMFEELLEIRPFKIIRSDSQDKIIIHLIKQAASETTKAKAASKIIDPLENGKIVLSMTCDGTQTDILNEYNGKALNELYGPSRSFYKKIIPAFQKFGRKLLRRPSPDPTRTVAAILYDEYVNNPFLDFGHALKKVHQSFGNTIEVGMSVVPNPAAERPEGKLVLPNLEVPKTNG